MHNIPEKEIILIQHYQATSKGEIQIRIGNEGGLVRTGRYKLTLAHCAVPSNFVSKSSVSKLETQEATGKSIILALNVRILQWRLKASVLPSQC